MFFIISFASVNALLWIWGLGGLHVFVGAADFIIYRSRQARKQAAVLELALGHSFPGFLCVIYNFLKMCFLMFLHFLFSSVHKKYVSPNKIHA